LVKLVDLHNHSLAKWFEGHIGAISSVAFTRDGKAIATLTTDGTGRLWDLESGRVRKPPGQPLRAVHSLAFSPDGQTLITGSHDWPAEVATYPLPGDTANYRSIIAGNTQEAVRLWDAATGRQRDSLPLHPLVRLRCLALSPDGRTLALGCSGGMLARWDLPAHQERSSLFVKPGDRVVFEGWATGWKLLPAFPEFPTSVCALAWAPDGKILASASDDGFLQLWDSAADRELAILARDRADVTCLAFSPDGKTLALNHGRQVELWDVAARQLKQTLAGHQGVVGCLAFSPDGTILASGSEDGRIKLWDLCTGQEKTTLVGHLERATSLAFTPDGKDLVSGSWDRSVRLWHVLTGRELLSLEDHQGKVHCVAFSADGRTLASGGELPHESEPHRLGTGEVFLWRAGPLGSRDQPDK
jgi:WD40 repeat protein